jgi:hypothetical protein
VTASIQCLKLGSAAEVMDTFETSDRVCEDDLPLALNYESTWTQHIVLRKWVDILTQYEIRVFVFQNRVTAMCQYFNDCHYPDLVANKDYVQELVLALFQKMKDRIPFEPKEYVADVAVDLAAGRAYLIELNPFGKPNGQGTGTVMFDSANPSDLNILFGDAPFEFRVETAPIAIGGFKRLLKEPWKSFLQSQCYI